jgi:hypothetical protein
MVIVLALLQMIVAAYVLVVTPDMMLTVIKTVMVIVSDQLQTIIAAYVLVVTPDMMLTVI